MGSVTAVLSGGLTVDVLSRRPDSKRKRNPKSRSGLKVHGSLRKESAARCAHHDSAVGASLSNRVFAMRFAPLPILSHTLPCGATIEGCNALDMASA